MPVTDIRVFKTELRRRFRELRTDMPEDEKKTRDARIRKRVQALYQYKREKVLLLYISTAIEVDTNFLRNSEFFWFFTESISSLVNVSEVTYKTLRVGSLVICLLYTSHSDLHL